MKEIFKKTSVLPVECTIREYKSKQLTGINRDLLQKLYMYDSLRLDIQIVYTFKSRLKQDS